SGPVVGSSVHDLQSAGVELWQSAGRSVGPGHRFGAGEGQAQLYAADPAGQSDGDPYLGSGAARRSLSAGPSPAGSQELSGRIGPSRQGAASAAKHRDRKAAERGLASRV